MTDCRVCDRPTPDQAVLCAGCGNQLAVALGQAEGWETELRTAIERRAKLGDGNGGSTSERPLPIDYDASIMLSALRNTLVTWVRVLANDIGYDGFPTDDIPAMARWLLARLEQIRHHEAGDQAYDEITSIAAACERAVDRPAGQIDLGACVECGAWEVRLDLGAIEARCGACGARVRTEQLLKVAEDHLGTAAEVTRLLKVFGLKIGTSTVRQWASRGRLEVRGERVVGDKKEPMYRVGDVKVLLSQASEKAKAS